MPGVVDPCWHGSGTVADNRRVDGLELVVLRSADLEAARGFYECIGLRFQMERHGDGPEHCSAAGSAGVLEIYPALDGVPDRVGLGFAVADVVAAAEVFRVAGFVPGEISDKPWGSSFVVRDPDDRRVEVRQAPERT